MSKHEGEREHALAEALRKIQPFLDFAASDYEDGASEYAARDLANMVRTVLARPAAPPPDVVDLIDRAVAEQDMALAKIYAFVAPITTAGGGAVSMVARLVEKYHGLIAQHDGMLEALRAIALGALDDPATTQRVAETAIAKATGMGNP
jgi:hypothetical protein